MAQDLTTLEPAVRRKLNVTWTDADTDARIKEIMAIADADLRHKLGLPTDYDFNRAGQEQKLFLSYCLYEWNHVANEFDANYANDILQVRQKYAVMGVQDADQD